MKFTNVDLFICSHIILFKIVILFVFYYTSINTTKCILQLRLLITYYLIRHFEMLNSRTDLLFPRNQIDLQL